MSERMNNERAREILKEMKNARVVYLQDLSITKTEKRTERRNQELQALDIAIESLDNEWQTDTPKESGYYLVTNGADKLDIRKYDNGWYHDMYRRYTNEELEIIAWKKVEPYERKE